MGQKSRNNRKPTMIVVEERPIEDSEDYCFVCKDGGLLVLCDHEDCTKSYHGKCVKKKFSVDSEEEWICDWHSCCKCGKSSSIRCFCCTNAVCESCVTNNYEFARIRGAYGICDECLKLAIMVEEGRDVDSEGEEADFNDRESTEGLFKEYWEIIRDKENITLKDLQAAKAQMENSTTPKPKSTSKRAHSDEYAADEAHEEVSDADCDMKVTQENKSDRKKGSKKRQKKENKGSKKREIIAWNSSEYSGDEAREETLNADCNMEIPQKNTSDIKRPRQKKEKKENKGSNKREVLRWGSGEYAGGEAPKEASDADCNMEITEKNRSDCKKTRRKKKRENKASNKREFIGWGSKPLIEFLASIGKDTSQKISQGEVADIMIQYARENNLFDITNKKKIICDAGLNSVLGRKSLTIYKMRDFLENHFWENIEDSDELGDSSENEELKDLLPSKKLQKHNTLKTCTEKDTISEKNHESKATPKVLYSCYASIVPENISLVYLRRTLVEELLNKSEKISDDKVIGSIVRVKNRVTKYKPNELLQVTDIIRQASENKTDIFLKVTGMANDVPISMLDDYNFFEDECDDLREKVEKGIIERPTVASLQEKANSLHEDKTKHAIPRDLMVLQHRIDLANEKGWRDQFYELTRERKLLLTAEGQMRRLQTLPKVIADVLEDAKSDSKETADKDENEAMTCT